MKNMFHWIKSNFIQIKTFVPQFPNLQYWDNYKTYLIEQLRESNEIIPKKNMVGFESQKD